MMCYPWWNSPTIIATMLVLEWHLTKHYMVEDVEPHCVGIRMVKPLCLVLSFCSKRLEKSN